ncbi:MAG: DUF3126 family protein [Pseudomonadota bacterium]
MIEQPELDLLTAYLADMFNDGDLVVLAHPENDDEALVAVGQTFFARISRDEDEGEVSYNFAKDIPDAPHDELDGTLKDIFKNDNVRLQKRPNKTDSAEVYRGEEFLGVLYDDEGSVDGMQVFNMAILDIDLDMDGDGGLGQIEA